MFSLLLILSHWFQFLFRPPCLISVSILLLIREYYSQLFHSNKCICWISNLGLFVTGYLFYMLSLTLSPQGNKVNSSATLIFFCLKCFFLFRCRFSIKPSPSTSWQNGLPEKGFKPGAVHACHAACSARDYTSHAFCSVCWVTGTVRWRSWEVWKLCMGMHNVLSLFTVLTPDQKDANITLWLTGKTLHWATAIWLSRSSVMDDYVEFLWQFRAILPLCCKELQCSEQQKVHMTLPEH